MHIKPLPTRRDKKKSLERDKKLHIATNFRPHPPVPISGMVSKAPNLLD